MMTRLTAQERQDILAKADDMLGGVFRFDGVWDMEPCLEPVANRKLDWDVTYRGDIEWAYMFTRMDYLYVLALSSEIKGDKEPYLYGLKIIGKWYRDNRMYLKGGALNVLKRKVCREYRLGHRTLDVSIMASNIADYVIWGVEHGILGADASKHYLKIVEDVCDYVFRYSDGDYKSFSNWGIQENGNIVYCQLRLGMDRNLQEAGSRLVRQVYNQILPDGSHIESSPMYLAEILLILLKVMNVGRDTGVCEKLTEPVAKGCEYIRSIRTLSNTIPGIGDSDCINISDLMLIAGRLLNRPDFCDTADRPLDPEYCFKFRMEREMPRESIGSDGIELTELLHQVACRSDKDGFYVLCSNTPRNDDGHKHCDYLSVLYSESGKDVLVDAGRYSYRNDDSRRFSKGPEGHNTVRISGDDFYRYVDSWVSRERVTALGCRARQGEGWMSVRMQCVYGYRDVTVCRYVTYVYGIGLLITDMPENGGDLQYETYFNIGHEFDVEKVDGGISVHDGSGISLTYSNDRSLDADIIPMRYSKRYNQSIQSVQLSVRNSGGVITHWFLKNGEKPLVSYTEKTIEYNLTGYGLQITVPLNFN